MTHEVHIRMEVGQHHEVITLDVADIGHDNIILGISWLRQHNPRIDWARSTLGFDSDYCKTWCSPPSPVSISTQEKDPPLETGEAAWRRKAGQQAPPGHCAHLKAIRMAQTAWYRSARVAALQEASSVLHKLWQERISFSGAMFVQTSAIPDIRPENSPFGPEIPFPGVAFLGGRSRERPPAEISFLGRASAALVMENACNRTGG